MDRHVPSIVYGFEEPLKNEEIEGILDQEVLHKRYRGQIDVCATEHSVVYGVRLPLHANGQIGVPSATQRTELAKFRKDFMQHHGLQKLAPAFFSASFYGNEWTECLSVDYYGIYELGDEDE